MDISWDRLDAAAWAAALPDTACALQQSWRYGAAVQALGRDVLRAEIWGGGRFYGLAQVILRRFGPLRLGFLARGPIWMDHAPSDAAGALQAIRRALPGRGPSGLLGVSETQERTGLPLLTPQYMAELRLSADPARMRARMHQKWRNRLVRAEAARLKIAVTRPSEADVRWLIDRDRTQARARGYRGLPPAFLSAWAAQKGPPMRLFTARKRGEVIAAMLFLDHAPGATYHLGWSGAEGRAQNAHTLLLWRAMQTFAADGRRRLDLGPLDTVHAPGLARFKLGSGAEVRVLGATSLILPGGRFFTGRGARDMASLPPDDLRTEQFHVAHGNDRLLSGGDRTGARRDGAKLDVSGHHL